jgi:hypothetical protein
MTDRLDDLLNEDEDDTPDTPADKPKTDNQLQAAQRKLAKAEKELEELRAYKTERVQQERNHQIEGVFTELGLSPKHAKLYAALNPEGDATTELVAGFATEYGLGVVGEGAAEAAAPVERGYTPTVIGEAAPLGAKAYSVEEWRNISMQDPKQGQQLLAQGRVLGVTITEDGRVDMASLRPGL